MNTLADFWPQGVLTLALIFICGLLMLVILIQKGRGGGLAGAFGGGGGGSAAFGTKTGDVFTWITIALAMLFLLMTIVANFAFDQSVSPVAAAPAVPAAAPVGVSGSTGSGVPVSLGEIPDGWPAAGGLEEDTDLDTAEPIGASADDGAAADAPPAEAPPAEDPPATEAESSQESGEGGTPAP